MTDAQIASLNRLGQRLIDQEKAFVIIEAQRRSSGFWFGGGNMIEIDGTLYLSGRYRNFGDSRTGLGMGERGLELAIFASTDSGKTWEKINSFCKSDLNLPGMDVLSIEGTALRKSSDGVELFLSTEKDGRTYPDEVAGFQKSGTGIWSIDLITGGTPADLSASSIQPVLSCDDPQYIHVKDPFIYDSENGDTILGFCTHPFNWASSNTGYTSRPGGTEKWSDPVYDHFSRGTTWDAGMSRGTAIVDIPAVGLFADEPITSLFFYDGGESVRNLDEHAEAVKRPRGYSCEELGGLACLQNGNLDAISRISRYLPAFVSPHGAGTSRYVDVLTTADGMYATWQQSQEDYSQPLVMTFLSNAEIEALLSY